MPTYDAWNRQTKVTKAYRDSGGTLQTHSVINEFEHDGLGRRIVKQVKNSADDGDRVIEERNGSDQARKQYVLALSIYRRTHRSRPQRRLASITRQLDDDA